MGVHSIEKKSSCLQMGYGITKWLKQMLDYEECEVFESSVRPEGPPKGDGRAARGRLRQRAIAPHDE